MTKDQQQAASSLSNQQTFNQTFSTSLPKLHISSDSNNNNCEEWKRWWQQMELYLLATGLDKAEEKRKIAILLHSMGTKGLEIFNTFNLNINESTFEAVTKKFDNYFEPKKNLTMCRYAFFTRKQSKSESIQEFLTDLENKSNNCEFGDLKESLIRDIFIANMHVDLSHIRQRLLQESTLTYEKMKEIATTVVIAQQDADKIVQENAVTENVMQLKSRWASQNHSHGGNRQSRSTSQGRSSQSRTSSRSRASSQAAFKPSLSRASSQVTNVQSSSQPAHHQGQRSTCSSCGQIHRYKCPAAHVRCRSCNKIGHYSKLCFKNKNVMHLESINPNDESAECSERFFIGSVNGYVNGYVNNNVNNKCKESWDIDIKIDSHTVNCILDSGADVNMMSLSTYTVLNTSNKYNLQKSNVKVSGFGGKDIPVVGQCEFNCKLGNKTENIVFIVTDINCHTVLGLPTCQKLQILKRVFTVSDHSCETMLMHYHDVFQGLGCLPPVCHLKIKPDAVPCIDPPRKVPFALLQDLREELDRMEELHVIEKVTKPTAWVNSVVVTKKSTGQLRICLDPRNLNCNIMREHYPLKNIDEIRSQLKGSAYYSHLDAFSGFWSLKLDEESSELCTFQTPFGRYKYLRLPFGINAATEIFYRVITELFGDIEGVLIFVDDFLVYGETPEIHNERLKKVLDRARQVNLKLNKSKCKFLVKEVEFLGYIFSQDGVKVNTERVEAINKMPSPQNIKELQRFLGMVNYLGSFIKNLSEKTQLLRDLLKKNVPWQWDENYQKCYDELKQAISSTPVLAHYDTNTPLVLSVDSSKSAVGAVILQNNKPVAYSSRTLTKTQENYAQIEKELFAIQFGCVKFNQYVYGHKVTVQTDHKPLVYLFKKPLHEVPTRLQRMMLSLQKYDLEVVHVPGKQMYISDTLSRAAMKDHFIPDNESEIICHVNVMYANLAVSQEYATKICQATMNDESLQMLKKYYYDGWPNSKDKIHSLLKPYWNIQSEIHVINNLLFKGSKLIVPKSLHKEMLHKIHAGHQGICKCLSLARETLYWPNMSVDIKNLVEQCQVCAKFRPHNQKEPLKKYKITDYPWQQLGIDLMHFDNATYLVVIDYYSKYIEIALLNKDSTAKSVIMSLKSIFARHGIPMTLVSDGGPPFQSIEFKKFCHEWDIEHVTTAPYHSQSNGQAESGVKIARSILDKCKEIGSDPYIALLQYRNTPKDGLSSPAQLLMSRNLRDNIPISCNKLRPKIVKFNTYEQAHNESNMRQSKYYNRHVKPLSLLQPGDHVYYKKNPNSNWDSATIVKRLPGDRSYVINNRNNVTYTRNRIHLRHKYSNISNSVRSSSTTGDDVDVRQGTGTQEAGAAKTTRSGRVIIPVQRLIEEV